MTVFRRFSPKARAAFWVAAMIVIWLAFAPTKAGGTTSYIIVIGNSMEPGFHIGDLVVVREASDYQVGDAVAYRNAELGSFVFHRIVSAASGRYTLKGDNNSWLDNYQPTQADVIGRLWLHIPKGGIIVQKMRAPIIMALLAGALGWLVATSLFTGKSKGRQRMNNKSIGGWFASVKQKMRNWIVNANGSDSGSGWIQTGRFEASFLTLGLVALISIILAIITFSRPVSRPAQSEFGYQHLGVFSYSGAAPQGIYDANTIQSGDPIFPRLTCSVDIAFHYTLIASEVEDIAGTYQMTAILTEEVSGWRRIIPLQDETKFSGDNFGSTAKLDLCKLEALTQSLEGDTEFHPATYSLTIVPDIKVAGTLSTHAFESTFNRGLMFRYDHIHFFLAREEEQGNPLTITETGALIEEHMEDNTVSALGIEMAVSALRVISLLGLLASLAGLIYLGLKLQQLTKNDSNLLTRVKYGSMMIDVQRATPLQNAGVIEVKSLDDLAKLAERFNTIILHEAQDGVHSYFVQGEGSAYRFVMADDSGGAS